VGIAQEFFGWLIDCVGSEGREGSESRSIQFSRARGMRVGVGGGLAENVACCLDLTPLLLPCSLLLRLYLACNSGEGDGRRRRIFRTAGGSQHCRQDLGPQFGSSDLTARMAGT
jgi:hypothetical protein